MRKSPHYFIHIVTKEDGLEFTNLLKSLGKRHHLMPFSIPDRWYDFSLTDNDFNWLSNGHEFSTSRYENKKLVTVQYLATIINNMANVKVTSSFNVTIKEEGGKIIKGEISENKFVTKITDTDTFEISIEALKEIIKLHDKNN